MSKQAKILQFKQNYKLFSDLNPKEELETLNIALVDFDGPDIHETKVTLSFCLDTINILIENDLTKELSWHAFNTLPSLMQSVHSYFVQLKNSKDQSSFQNFSTNLDSLAYHLRMFGAPLIIINGGELEKTTSIINTERDRLIKTREELEVLQNQVKALIEPGMAGSLSKSFTDRRKTLLWGRIAWGGVAIFVGGYCIHATYEFASAVGTAIIANQVAKQISSDYVWLALLIRSAILIPLYAAFLFSFSQYKKERDFEEEYAHKAAVATSLPNYGDLTREPAVRDQIVTGATNVIFSSPTTKSVDNEKNDKTLGNMKELVDSLTKLISKKE